MTKRLIFRETICLYQPDSCSPVLLMIISMSITVCAYLICSQHVQVPVPSPKANEVLLKLEATSLNPVDWKIQKGMIRPFLPRKFPCIPGILFAFKNNMLRVSCPAWLFKGLDNLS